MWAAILEDNRLVVRDVPLPELKEGEILVEMRACGLCGSDIEKIRGEYDVSPIIGHEASGIISEINGDLEGLSVGDRIFPHHHVPCYSCHYCSSGSETMCESYRLYHFHPGGFAEFFRVPAWNIARGGILKIPDGMSFEEASFIEPTACCIRALQRSRIVEGERILVVGSGPIGLTFIQLAPLFGVRDAFASDVNPLRLEHALKYGASAAFDPGHDDIPSSVGEATGGRGVDVAIIASGSSNAIKQGLESIRSGGRALLFGIPPVGSRLDYDLSKLINREISIISSNASTERETVASLDFISEGRIEVQSMITGSYPIGKFREAVDAILRGEGIKVMITP